MSKELTERQREILEFLMRFGQDHGFPASVKDIMTEFDFASPASVTDHLQALVRKGYIRHHARLSRGIEILEKAHESLFPERAAVSKFPFQMISLPLVGRVAAGSPTLAVEDIEARYQVDRQLFHGNPTFLLRVEGESMIEVGIHDGDFVAVERMPVAKNGEIIVAMIDGEATVKTYYREGRQIRLQPENEALDPIYVDPAQVTFEVVGRVVGLIRRF